MTREDPSSLSDLLARLSVRLTEPVDFTETDREATIAKVRLLSAVATYFNVLALTEFGERIGPERHDGLVEHVIGAAFQTFGGIDPHPDPFEKAAMLVRGITQGHPFFDANRRTGFLLASYYLDQMGYDVVSPFPEEAAIALAMRVSSGELRDIAQIAEALRVLYAAHPLADE